jgi:hypothetical protein
MTTVDDYLNTIEEQGDCFDFMYRKLFRGDCWKAIQEMDESLTKDSNVTIDTLITLTGQYHAKRNHRVRD